MERTIDRLDKYMSQKGLNDNQVTVQCNLSVGLLGKARKEGKEIGKRSIEKILNRFPEINRVWFLTGEGEMLSKPSESSNNNSSDDSELSYLRDKLLQQAEEIGRLKSQIEVMKKGTEAG